MPVIRQNRLGPTVLGRGLATPTAVWATRGLCSRPNTAGRGEVCFLRRGEPSLEQAQEQKKHPSVYACRRSGRHPVAHSFTADIVRREENQNQTAADRLNYCHSIGTVFKCCHDCLWTMCQKNNWSFRTNAVSLQCENRMTNQL